MDDYEPTRAARVIETFVDEHLSNWYVRLSRRRFWRGEMTTDKRAAYQTLYECIMVTTQLSASLAPFFSDWMYQNLTNTLRETGKTALPESVHLTNLTQPQPHLIDTALEKRMDYAQRICSLALSLRKREKIRVRQPLQKLLLPVLDEAFIAQVESVKDLIINEINVKKLEYITDSSGLISKKAKANFKTLGKRLGKQMRDVANAVEALTNEQISAIERDGTYTVTLANETVDITPDDLLISTEDLPGWSVATEGTLTVALDTTLTDVLLAEGTARDLVSRIQSIRKERDFDMADRITLGIEAHPSIRAAVEQFGAYIQAEVLANTLTLADNITGDNIELADGISLQVDIQKA